MKVNVKEIKDEAYKDRTQRWVSSTYLGVFKSFLPDLTWSSVLVNMWNHTSFPAYKSRLWDMQGTSQEASGAEKRKPYVRRDCLKCKGIGADFS